MIRPSDYARSVFMKNIVVGLPAADAVTDGNSKPMILQTKIEEYEHTFHETSSTDIEFYKNHSAELYGYIRKGTDLEGFKACVRRLRRQYPSQRIFRCCNKFGE